MTHTLYLGLGSNLGPCAENLQKALELIDERVGSVYRVSSFVETAPEGFSSPHIFLNAVCLVRTHLSPLRCLEETQEIERLMGRTHKSAAGVYRDRIIDIDLLMYDDVEMQTPELTLPHPRMKERDFVMLPLREIRIPECGNTGNGLPSEPGEC